MPSETATDSTAHSPGSRLLLLVPVATLAALLDLVLRRGFANVATEVLDLDLALGVERLTRFVANFTGLATVVGLVSLVRAIFREPTLRLGALRRLVVGGLTVVTVGTLFAALVLPEPRFHAVPLITLTLTGYAATFVLSWSLGAREVPGFGRLVFLGLAIQSVFGVVAAMATLVSSLSSIDVPLALPRVIESILEFGYFLIPAAAAGVTAKGARPLARLAAAGGAFASLAGIALLAARHVPDAFASIFYRAFHAGGVANLPAPLATAVVSMAFACATFAALDRTHGRNYGIGALCVLAAGCAPVSPLGIGLLLLGAATLAAEPDAPLSSDATA